MLVGQILAWRLFVAKPIPQPTLAGCHLDPQEDVSLKYVSKYEGFDSRTFVLKYRLQICDHLIAFNVWYLDSTITRSLSHIYMFLLLQLAPSLGHSLSAQGG